MIHSEDGYDAFFLINDIKNSEFTNAVAPRAWNVPLQLFDVSAKMRFHSELRVDVGGKLILDKGLIGGIKFFEFL